MQDGRDNGRALKPGAVEIEQTLYCGIKEQFIERLLVMEQKRMQLVWKRKDYVVVRHGKSHRNWCSSHLWEWTAWQQGQCRSPQPSGMLSRWPQWEHS